jgi:hypothetical protein
MSRIAIILIPLLAGLVLATGCQSTWNSQRSPLLDRSWMSSHSSSEADQIEYGTPERMAVIWTDSIASASNHPNVRGFGGRLYFYDKNGLAIRVDGDLSVYAYDDTAKSEKSQADRVYKFRREEWQTHFSETSLGPSYSIWIPWDQVGGNRKAISLFPIFKTPDNLVVKSGQSINVLPGKTPVQIAAQTNDVFRVLGSSPSVATSIAGPGMSDPSDYPVQQASHVEPDAQSTQAPGRSTTISVPKQMARRLHEELAATSSGGAMPGSQVHVSYGQEADQPAGSADGSRLTAAPSDDLPLPPNASALPASKSGSRPVFGAPGARK